MIPAVLSRQIHILSISWVVAYLLLHDLYLFDPRKCLIKVVHIQITYILQYVFVCLWKYRWQELQRSYRICITKCYVDQKSWKMMQMTLHSCGPKDAQQWSTLFQASAHPRASISKLHKKDNLTFKSPKYRPWTPGLCNGSWREIMQSILWSDYEDLWTAHLKQVRTKFNHFHAGSSICRSNWRQYATV